jgi:hypothetical protein
MPQLNKVEVRDLIRQLIDDPGGKLWNTTNLDLLIEGCLDELWGEIIDQFPWVRWTETSAITLVAPGYVQLWDDATTSDFNRLYRIQRVVRNGIEYHIADQRDVTIAGGEVIAAPNYSYTILGRTLHLFPYDITANVTIQYSSLPEPFTSLTPGPDPDDPSDDEISLVEWPDGYHMAYIYDVASKAIEKGDREDSTRLGRRAEASLFRLKAFLRKQHTGPIMPYVSDDGLNLT